MLISYTGLSPTAFFCSSVNLSFASSTPNETESAFVDSNIELRTSFSIMMFPSEVGIETESMLLLFSMLFAIVSKSALETVTAE